MATANNKRIEESATTALKTALLCCPILDSYIDSNDKTPSWDGSVFVYRNEKQKKCDLRGKVPIQVKGTETVFVSKTVTFSCSLADLRNYYNDGGCLFFLVSVTPSTGDHKIFYSSLLVYDLKKIIDKAGKQKTYTIHLKEFPEGNINEISSIFLSFVENSPKQMSFIGKELCSFESLQEKGIAIEALTFNASGVGLNDLNIGNFLTSHDFYLYAKPKGLDIEIPIEKVSNAIVVRQIPGAVAVKDTVYYNSYNIVYKNSNSIFQIGKSINLTLSLDKSRIDINFKPSGTLSDFIQDATFYIAMIENREVTLNGGRIPFPSNQSIDVEFYKSSLKYFRDVKTMLTLLGVHEELQFDSLSENDEKNIRIFTNAVLFNKEISFSEVDGNFVFGGFKINNLTIWIWADRQENGYYKLSSFFAPHPIVIFDPEDTNNENPIPASQFLLLNKDAFLSASNMDYEKIIQDINQMPYNELSCDSVTNLILTILSAYDEQNKKNSKLLDLAQSLSEWTRSDETARNHSAHTLNYFQIIRRKRDLSINEILEVGKLTTSENNILIRCGAYLVLGEANESQNCFDQFSLAQQAEFLTYPICNLGNLKRKKDE